VIGNLSVMRTMSPPRNTSDLSHVGLTLRTDVAERYEANKRPEPVTTRFLDHDALTHADDAIITATTKPRVGLVSYLWSAGTYHFRRVFRVVTTLHNDAK
jgi:hypothetical protein